MAQGGRAGRRGRLSDEAALRPQRCRQHTLPHAAHARRGPRRRALRPRQPLGAARVRSRRLLSLTLISLRRVQLQSHFSRSDEHGLPQPTPDRRFQRCKPTASQHGVWAPCCSLDAQCSIRLGKSYPPGAGMAARAPCGTSSGGRTRQRCGATWRGTAPSSRTAASACSPLTWTTTSTARCRMALLPQHCLHSQ